MEKKLTLCLISMIVLAGCTAGATYFPNVQNVPLVQSENDFMISAHIDVEEIGGGHLQFAKPVANRFILMGNFLYRDYGNCEDCRTYKRNFGELGLGYYFPNERDKESVTEVFAGFGTGTSETLENNGLNGSNPDEVISAEGRYFRLFIQGDYGARNKTFEYANSIRISGVRFYNYEEYLTQPGSPDIKQTNNDAAWRVFVEPAITGRIGFENVKLSGQIGFSIPITKKSNFRSRYGWTSIGLQINLSQTKKN